MDDQQSTQNPMGQPADPMSTAPVMPTTPSQDSGAMAGVGDAAAMPTPAPAMDAMASGMTPPAPMADSSANPMPAMPAVTPPAASGPATMDDLMAELHKIEDKLVEMDEKL